MREERTIIGNGLDDEIKKINALKHVGAGIAVLFLALLVIMLSMHGLH